MLTPREISLNGHTVLVGCAKQGIRVAFVVVHAGCVVDDLLDGKRVLALHGKTVLGHAVAAPNESEGKMDHRARHTRWVSCMSNFGVSGLVCF